MRRNDCIKTVPGRGIINQDIKERMKCAILDTGVNIATFSKLHGISRKTFYGLNEPSIQVLDIVSYATGKSIDYFVRG